jgi:hypothetical protein
MCSAIEARWLPLIDTVGFSRREDNFLSLCGIWKDKYTY